MIKLGLFPISFLCDACSSRSTDGLEKTIFLYNSIRVGTLKKILKQCNNPK